MHEKLSRKVCFGGLPVLAGVLAASSCVLPESKPSTSVTCTDLTLQKDSQASTPNTYDAVLHWQQKPGPEAKLMRFSFFNGETTTLFPVSGITGQEQILRLSPVEGNLAASVMAIIIDETNRIASCPATPVDIPSHFAGQ